MNHSNNHLEIIELYKSGISLTKLASKYKKCRCKITKIIKDAGIDIVNRQNSTTIIEDYFKNIDSEEKAYWLGFMYADGYVAKKTNHIELSLKKDDSNHLIKFAKAINFTNNIIIDDYRCRVCFANKQMKIDLVNQGCIPQKSLILEYSANVPNELKRHFIRGYFEGDGCVVPGSGKKWKNPAISILGTSNMLNWINNNSINLNDVKLKQNDKDNFITLMYNLSGQNCRNFLEFIYNDCKIYLNRKFERFMLYKIARYGCETIDESNKIGGSLK